MHNEGNDDDLLFVADPGGTARLGQPLFRAKDLTVVQKSV